MSERKLYTYFRSSAAWRVRIALHWKGLDYQAVPVHLLRDGGEQRKSDYLSVNPYGLVPTFVTDGTALTQSLAICEYLDERYPEPPLLPADALARAQVRSLAYAICSDIHPINNLRILKYLKGTLGQSQEVVDEWIRHWVGIGFTALETELARAGSKHYCHGGELSLADLCLVPQVFNARRFQLDLTPFPHIVAIDAHLAELPAFAATHPARQPDSE
ncbi:maleylacetoacetate isomerase family protein [Chitinimonas naiadis]